MLCMLFDMALLKGRLETGQQNARLWFQRVGTQQLDGGCFQTRLLRRIQRCALAFQIA